MGKAVLLSGATGFVGSSLARALVEAGHTVRAMTRRPEEYEGAGSPVFGDAMDADSLGPAMQGCSAAYYLVHSLGERNGFDRDAEAAESFGRAAAAAGLEQIVYLGGLGAGGKELSDHLASRQDVEDFLGRGGVPVTVLRAAIVIGKGSASFELLRQVVDNLPVLVVPAKASESEVQPIALADTVRYLVGVLGLPEALDTVLEIGGPEVLTYEELLHRMAEHLDKDRRGLRMPPVPGIVAKLGVKLVTDVDPQLAVVLLDSLGVDVVADSYQIRHLLPGTLQSVDEMIAAALAE